MKNDDLLNTNPKKDLKKPLIFGAIGFLIFVIIVIIIAIFQNTTSNITNEILPPVENNSMNNVDNTIFKPLKIETNTTENQSNENKNNNNNKNITNNKEKNTINKEVLLKENEKNSISINNNKLNIKKNLASQTLLTKTTNTKKVSKPKKTEKITQKTVKNGKYYIQVAALLKNSKPNKKFLNLITKSGFKYTFYHTYIKRNGEKIKVTKILIGPFKTKKDAKKALYKVKREITQTAFIFKVK